LTKKNILINDFLFIFQTQQKPLKYGVNYIGNIERNYWGTIFTVFDYGLEPELVAKIPKYFAKEKRKIGEIIYETNILAS